MDNSTYKNKLANSSSPYLLQHAKNPVDWHEWNNDTLNKAKKENKMLLISIGYSACHWCHVMEKESFMDKQVAEIMNKYFVCIKVDREERPDVDQVYMNAAQLLNGNGGWPLNAFALPDGRPFYAGTYFPKQTWINLLEKLNELYQNEKSKINEQAEKLTQGINEKEFEIETNDNSEFDKEIPKQFSAKIKSYIDFKLGGFGRAPKFPLPAGLESLLYFHKHYKDFDLLEALNITLTEMLKGGIYDQIGGGFARYSVDEKWFVPHFEKMLYDNGQLVSLYANAFKKTKNPDYEIIVKETLDWVKREMTNDEGGFYSSLNADSEGVEGKFYVWEKAELDKIAADDAELFQQYFNYSKLANWEEGNIPYLKTGRREFAESKGMSVAEWTNKLNDFKMKALQQREKRERPSTDDKILCSWNALMLKAYLDAYSAFGENQYLEAAKQNLEFVKNNFIKDDFSFFRNYKDGKSSIDAFLEDYALLIDAIIKYYSITFDFEWLEIARKLADYTIENFYDNESGMFHFTSVKSEKLAARKIDIHDNVIPSPNSVMANALFDLSVLFDNSDYRSKSEKMLKTVQDKIADGGPYFANWSMLLHKLTNPLKEVVIMGEEHQEINSKLQKHYLPEIIFAGGNSENLPLTKSRLKKSKTLIYVCNNSTCLSPLESYKDAISEID